MSRVIILRGLPASGKSTWAKDFVNNNSGWVRVNKDEIRLELGDNYPTWYKKEKDVFKRERELIKQYLDNNTNIVIDNTHLNPKTLNDTIKFVESNGGVVEDVMFFQITVEDAIKRDGARENPVGSYVIMQMANKWLNDD